MTPNDCREDRGDTRHRLTCPACRAEARLAPAWNLLRDRLRAAEADEPVSERLVAAILDSARRDRSRRDGVRSVLAAAAALLFFFFVGLGFESAVQTMVSAEATYAGIVSPSAVTVEDLIPN
jgi:anti-sigma factor RsiW